MVSQATNRMGDKHISLVVPGHSKVRYRKEKREERRAIQMNRKVIKEFEGRGILTFLNQLLSQDVLISDRPVVLQTVVACVCHTTRYTSGYSSWPYRSSSGSIKSVIESMEVGRLLSHFFSQLLHSSEVIWGGGLIENLQT